MSLFGLPLCLPPGLLSWASGTQHSQLPVLGARRPGQASAPNQPSVNPERKKKFFCACAFFMRGNATLQVCSSRLTSCVAGRGKGRGTQSGDLIAKTAGPLSRHQLQGHSASKATTYIRLNRVASRIVYSQCWATGPCCSRSLEAAQHPRPRGQQGWGEEIPAREFEVCMGHGGAGLQKGHASDESRDVNWGSSAAYLQRTLWITLLGWAMPASVSQENTGG